ncbi:hypothetical protein HDU79_009999 [Rhizoclosmatium sp. JEL0117]|nr:hypothetical protein HDU79_009999 [Rhizoclosmatium sp. JEL0117]
MEKVGPILLIKVSLESKPALILQQIKRLINPEVVVVVDVGGLAAPASHQRIQQSPVASFSTLSRRKRIHLSNSDRSCPASIQSLSQTLELVPHRSYASFGLWAVACLSGLEIWEDTACQLANRLGTGNAGERLKLRFREDVGFMSSMEGGSAGEN